jgi:hypothetical protein
MNEKKATDSPPSVTADDADLCTNCGRPLRDHPIWIESTDCLEEGFWRSDEHAKEV